MMTTTWCQLPPSTAPSTPPCHSALASESPQKVDFTSHYAGTATIVNGFEAFLKLPQENFSKCDPLKWWAAQITQFLTLSLLTKDIFSIPSSMIICKGSVFLTQFYLRLCCCCWVHLFGQLGHYLPSTCKFELETIQVLMLVKHHLWLVWEWAYADLQVLTREVLWCW